MGWRPLGAFVLLQAKDESSRQDGWGLLCELWSKTVIPQSQICKHKAYLYIFKYAYVYVFIYVYSYKCICNKIMILHQNTHRPNVKVVAQAFFQENFHPAKEIPIIFTNFWIGVAQEIPQLHCFQMFSKLLLLELPAPTPLPGVGNYRTPETLCMHVLHLSRLHLGLLTSASEWTAVTEG